MPDNDEQEFSVRNAQKEFLNFPFGRAEIEVDLIEKNQFIDDFAIIKLPGVLIILPSWVGN